MIYDNVLPIDMKYIDYDRNVKHLGSKERITIKIFAFVKMAIIVG